MLTFRYILYLLLATLQSDYHRSLDHSQNDSFKGKIVYSTEISGEDDEMVNMTKAYTGNPTIVYILEDLFMVTEVSESFGKKIGKIDLKNKKAWLKNSDRAEMEEAKFYSIDDLDESTKAFMPQNYNTEMEDTGETAEILGWLCKKYKVLKSGFVRADAEAYLWIASDLTITRARYNIETEWYRMISPIPLSIPTEGAIMKCQITEMGVTVVYTVTAMEKDASPE